MLKITLQALFARAPSSCRSQSSYGKKATTNHSRINELETYCQVVNERVVVDGNVITAGGVSYSVDSCLKILELRYKKEISENMAETLEVPCFHLH